MNTKTLQIEVVRNGHSQGSACRNTGIHHVGLYAKDAAASAAFYRDILGMQLVGGSGPEHPLGASAFVCSRPDQESHEIALFENPTFAHNAFKVSRDLASMRRRHICC
jgi:catechol 2,3-dioxygenase-like lactoylglutathione lyase family enzyme